MGIETVAAIGIPIALGLISKAMSDAGEGDVRQAQAGKTAAMEKAAGEYSKYRPEQNAAMMNAMRSQSTAMQGPMNALATMYGPSAGQAPAGLSSNPMAGMFPQNQVPPPPPPIGHASPGVTPPPSVPKPLGDALKIRAALGDYRPGNVAPTLGPQNPIFPEGGTDTFSTAMKRFR